MNDFNQNYTETKRTKFNNFVFKFFYLLFFAYVTLALIMCVTLSWYIHPYFSPQFTNLNLLFFTLSIILIFGFCLMVFFIDKSTIKAHFLSNRNFRIFTISGCLIIFILQCVLIYYILYIPVDDVKDITFFDFNLGNEIKNLPFINPGFVEYFQSYTDRWFLSGIFLQIYYIFDGSAIANFVNNLIFHFDNNAESGPAVFAILQIISSACVSLSIFLSCFIAKKLGGFFAGYSTLIFSFVLTGINPMSSVPYSDTFGMLFVVVCLFAYVCIKNPIVKYFLIASSGVLGYLIKPTAIAIIIAITFIKIIKFIINGNMNILKNNRWKKLILPTSCITIAIAITVSSALAISNFGIKYNPDAEFSYTHFLMMGANKDTSGQFSREDEDFSKSFKTKSDREANNIKTWVDRVASYGLLGNLELLAEKTITNYGCGSFMQPNCVNFNQPYNQYNNFLEWFYNAHDQHTPFQVDAESPHNCICQIFWFAILIGIICLVFLFKNKRNKYIDSMVICLLLISFFLLLFESCHRYLFIFLMYYIILGSLGIKEISVHYTKYIINNRKKFDNLQYITG